MKITLLLLITCFSNLFASAQPDPVLMRINGKDILRSEFEYSYNKSRSLSALSPQPSTEYVDSFVNAKLKVDQAQKMGIDTTDAFRQKLAGYRAKLVRTYLADTKEEEQTARRLYDEMKTNGRAEQVQLMHIFKYLPQTLTPSRIREADLLMDSLYKALTAPVPARFSDCVAKYSDDKKPFWVGWLETPEEFEKVAFSLPKGSISQPFYTPQGIHIVKVLDRKEMPSFTEMRSDIEHRLAYRQERDKEVQALISKLKSTYNYTPVNAAIEELLSKGETTQTLFALNGKTFTGSDFKHFAISYPRAIQKQFNAFVLKTILDCENDQLEQKYPTFNLLMQEYKERLLLSEIRNREAWNQATTDEVALAAYFKAHQSHYHWDTPRYKGAVLHCIDKRSAKYVRKRLKKLPQDKWAECVEQTFRTSSGMNVRMEQGVFALGDNPFVDKLVFKKSVNLPSVESYPFTVVVGQKQKGPDSYREVYEQLLADYQNFCENLWIKRLRASAKVEINQEVLKTVNNH
ncbi:peptidylprolyl isomerase [Bacteroides sp.]|uniref:peptidylprolyl isomerase n=1 Tax=Bacteroides sp. TaxID=29523 RepID=UPI002FCB0438